MNSSLSIQDCCYSFMILFYTTIDLSVTFYECYGFTVVLATIKLPIQTYNFDCIYDLYLNCFFEGSANWNLMCVCMCWGGEVQNMHWCTMYNVCNGTERREWFGIDKTVRRVNIQEYLLFTTSPIVCECARRDSIEIVVFHAQSSWYL